MPASVEELTRRSGFVFEGTVRRAGAPATVYVDRIFKGPEIFARFAGREIALAVGKEESVSSGMRAVFFTNGLRYGEGLTLQAAGRIDETGPEVERRVREAMMQANDDELFEHLREARLVVAGVVVAVAPLERPARAGTEHDPEWWEFIVEADGVEKGTLKSEKHKGKMRITAFFAHSADVAWYRSPKVNVGDRGVFILHEGEVRRHATPGPALIHSVDIRPASDLERVRALLERLR